MGIAGSRAAVIGGSIAGCSAAIALIHADCDVTVFERAKGTLSERGFGIGMPPSLLDTLISAGYVSPALRVVRGEERVFVVRDGDTPAGRVLWRQPLPVCFTNWSLLWRSLREQVADPVYRDGVAATIEEVDHTGVTVSAGTSGSMRFDLVIGADGYASTARQRVSPGPSLHLPGYGLWRGTYPEDLLPDGATAALEPGSAMVCFPGGHAMIYLIPDHLHPGRRLVNWGVYLSPPERMTDPALIPPGQVAAERTIALRRTVEMSFPPLWADVVGRTPAERISVQPIFDVIAPQYASGRLALAGDAGATARPHTGSGAVKALEDALALEAGCRAATEWAPVLARYDRGRADAGNALTALGRSLGRLMVEDTPDWGAMSDTDLPARWREAASGRMSLYD
jgi:2-polyprenyl-6-methoxyphenol hydroxylase-like FAD-dependent oxidoreductase